MAGTRCLVLCERSVCVRITARIQPTTAHLAGEAAVVAHAAELSQEREAASSNESEVEEAVALQQCASP